MRSRSWMGSFAAALLASLVVGRHLYVNVVAPPFLERIWTEFAPPLYAEASAFEGFRARQAALEARVAHLHSSWLGLYDHINSDARRRR